MVTVLPFILILTFYFCVLIQYTSIRTNQSQTAQQYMASLPFFFFLSNNAVCVIALEGCFPGFNQYRIHQSPCENAGSDSVGLTGYGYYSAFGMSS